MTIQDFIKALARGFQRSPSYIGIAVSIISGFLIFLIIAGIILKRRQYRNNRSIALKFYRDKIRALDLTINEIDFIDSLSFCLDKPWKKYLIVSNENTFLNCAEKLKSREGKEFSSDMMQRVGEKAGFLTPEIRRKKNGTRALTPGTPVKLETSNGSIFDARVVDCGESFFTLEGTGLPKTGNPLVIHIPDRTGLLAFSTTPSGNSTSSRLVLSHSDEPPVKRWGEIGGNRKSKDFTIYIKIDGETGPPVKTSLYRITKGGGYIENPGGLLTKYTDLRIFFAHQDKPGGFWINGEVRAESLDRKEVFVKFLHVKKSVKQ